ncbi:aromatic amino acid hydroxylase [Bacillus clarus]|uniref:Aromatic amino acid hydroxylase n=1 Tax=Bacillus clarus TaxID=2338372 RepID=A0A090YKD8_9BACI|nr:aromatic amino acid hydroxylase [Bacillus clarus]KFM99293.1 biopterin-dependent aromatic amino acid hydroxylase family protein [Bacillus clarus]RFT64444.1 aromatic amino acid hydroxylase [Bacillus clarus]
MTKKTEIPSHLKPFVSTQHYDQYTPVNHAVWRYIMRQNHSFLKDVAHPAYVNGLQSSGINIDAIPMVEEMNECLAPSGWGAVTIDGLIPGVAFFDFQGHGLLPIATDIRKVENIEYTPAPDIVHEAAGHAPILLDPTYAKYVKRFGQIGAKAFSTKEEHDAFEAVRTLTIVKESPTSTPEEVVAAENAVIEKQKLVSGLSEAEQISRLFWWTVEYGLIGNIDNPKIYGAGLLSSVGESKHCLTAAVEKVPFSIEACTGTTYDVTKMQPQLFVCESFEELTEALEKFSETMAFKTGGTEGLEKAIRSENHATTELSSGLQITGTFTETIKNDTGEVIYMRTNTPTALAIHNKQLANHSTSVHKDGFGTPVGLLDGNIALEDCTEEKLQSLGITIGNCAELSFASGVHVKGTVTDIVKNDKKIALISFTDCTVTHTDRLLFDASWGAFDMAVGSTITSVFPGAADVAAFFPMDEEVPETPAPLTLTELDRMYQTVRDIRNETTLQDAHVDRLVAIQEVLNKFYPKEWLLRLEILELLLQHKKGHETSTALVEQLSTFTNDEAVTRLINNGLALLPIKDVKNDATIN